MAKSGNKHADEKVAARTSNTGLPGAPAPLLARRRHEGFGGQISCPPRGPWVLPPSPDRRIERL